MKGGVRVETGEGFCVASAPGRLDAMGGFADYSGALVLETPLALRATAAVSCEASAEFRCWSREASSLGLASPVAFERETLLPGGEPLSYEEGRRLFREKPGGAWAAFVLGGLLVLAREKGVRFDSGLSLLLASDVPAGAGVASSAAIEVASLRAIAGAFGVAIDDLELARLAQRVENLVVGAPCGFMDQGTAVFGREGHLLPILCQPDRVEEPVPIPEGVEFVAVDSGARHEVGGEAYGAARVAAFMGYRILADRCGFRARKVGAGRVDVDDPRLGGYLSNLPLAELDAPDPFPESLSGSEFLERYGGTTDPVTQVEPERVYLVRAAVDHAVRESARSGEVLESFRRFARTRDERELRRIGETMARSHRSYSACGLGSAATDAIVEGMRGIGPSGGVFGARVTGGGGGGAVAALVRLPQGRTAVEAWVARHSSVRLLGGTAPLRRPEAIPRLRGLPSENRS